MARIGRASNPFDDVTRVVERRACYELLELLESFHAFDETRECLIKIAIDRLIGRIYNRSSVRKESGEMMVKKDEEEITEVRVVIFSLAA